MKTIVLALALSLGATSVMAEVEKKRVCIMQKDPKTNKEKEVCKDVKQHKKLEGTKVPNIK
jgi:hypothetical protein